MKTNHRFLLLAATLLAPWILQAETAVPDRISYQGLITDMAGNLVGDPDPENRTVIFRIWDHPTATAPENLLYSEEQVATIAKGEFSVLVGGGGALTSEPLGFPETEIGPGTINIADVFDGSLRYLGVTVDDGNVAADVEISPRQQIVTSPFSFRAKQAETVLNLGDQQVTLGKMATASVNSITIVDNSVNTQDLGTAAVTIDKLATSSVDLTKLVAAVREALCPAGSIMAFAGSSTNVPNGWLICDGAALKSTEYAGLHAAINTAWGDGSYSRGIADADPTTDFNVPDLRGMFLRGVNGSLADQWADPDNGSRVARYGGQSGNKVGSAQVGEFLNHDHTPDHSAAGYKYLVRISGAHTATSADNSPTELDLKSGGVMLAKGGSETRPNNAYVNYIIKY